MKRLAFLFSAVIFALVSVQLQAAPTPAKKTTNSYYSSPIKEFKGATFFQWKKYEPAVAAGKSQPAKPAVKEPAASAEKAAKTTASVKP